MADNLEATIATLSALQNQDLSIIRLSEPISASNPASTPAKRSSDVSTSAFDNPTPASLEADLSHYKELFSKLRFSYLEQVTKEKFLRAIVGEPPLIVEPQENAELEAQLAEVKGVLKAQKENVAALVVELEARGRELSRRYETISLSTTQLSALPSQIASLTTTLSALRTLQTPLSAHPSLSLPLPATLSLLSTRQSELDALDSQLKSLQHSLPRKVRELERLEGELKPLEVRRAGMVAAAGESRRRKEEGERGGGDDLEVRGRWYRGVETGLRGMLGVEA
ncbi:hypothetical protein MMC12_007157 [Toensbergia leucococca]|nr:hypothetical protein [Toensbergia leucococca]